MNEEALAQWGPLRQKEKFYKAVFWLVTMCNPTEEGKRFGRNN
jgi:hypothetical protein